jgi:hypothetical protein
LVLVREASRVLRQGQDLGEVLLHRVWGAGQEAALELVHRGVVVVDLCLERPDHLVMRCPGVAQLTQPPVFILLVSGQCLPVGLLRFGNGSRVPRLAAHQP